MNVSRNTVYNWFVKGSKHLNKVLPILKEKLIAKGAVVNCDETWYYLNIFWNQLILYLKDGRYNIDNSLAARTLRPMTVERKNSLTFGSHAGAKVSVIYHTFIETCKMRSLPGVWGGRFSGAGFKGACIALVDPQYKEQIEKELTEKYLEQFPEYEKTFHVFWVRPDDGARFVE